MGLYDEMFSETSSWERKDIVSFEGVTALKRSAKAILCKFEDDTERWVPFSQLSRESDVKDVGDTGELVVNKWIADQWENEEPKAQEKPVAVENVRVLRATERALLIQAGDDGEEVWIPKGQVDKASEVKDDGDVGTLLISAWIAEQKGFGPGHTQLERAFKQAMTDSAVPPTAEEKAAVKQRTAVDDLEDPNHDGDEKVPF